MASPAPLFPDIPDKSLAQMRIPKYLLDEITAAGTFESADFELDGVATVDEDGTHSKIPEPVKKGYELRQYGTASIGLKWRKVPVSENEEVRTKLDPKLLEKQLRMTKCAFDAFGKDPAFLVSDEERMKRIAARRVKHHVSAEFLRRVKACSSLQATVRRQVLGPLYPWYHISRLASSLLPPQAGVRKRPKNEAIRSPVRKNNPVEPEQSSPMPDIDFPQIPWCMCWITLDTVYGPDEKFAGLFQPLVRDFRAQQYETCLRRIDNIVFTHSPKGPSSAPSGSAERVLMELAALCNRFALRLFELGRAQLAHAFFSRVLAYTHMNSPGTFPGKHEFFAWTCDLIAFCLWQQGKYEVPPACRAGTPPPTPQTRQWLANGPRFPSHLSQCRRSAAILFDFLRYARCRAGAR